MSKTKKLHLIVFAVLAMGVVSSIAHAESAILKEVENAFIKIGEDLRPCVVNIDVTSSPSKDSERMDMDQYGDLFKFFGIPMPEGMGGQIPIRPRPMRATGSGFIVDKEGHILTNNHVVEGADKLTVRLSDGSEYEAKVVGADPDTEIAVIKINTDKDLPVARMGDSDALRVGQFAVAVGSPRGLEGSLSFGHVSALGREDMGLRARGLRFQNLIQTDAAINFGNSGGPLCNIDGEVIGVNVAIVFGAESLGFAIPVNTAKNVMTQLIETGKVTRGYLGVMIKDAAEYAEVESLKLPDGKGAFVNSVNADTPAAKAGIKEYDVIRQVNGTPVENAAELMKKISDFPPNTEVTLEVWREGKAVDLKVMLGEYPGAAAVKAKSDDSTLGLRVQGLTPDLAARLNIEAGTKGVLVANVEPASPADDARLAPGDVILEVAQQPVGSVDEFTNAIKAHAQPGKNIMIKYIRGSRTADITVIKVPVAESKTE